MEHLTVVSETLIPPSQSVKRFKGMTASQALTVGDDATVIGSEREGLAMTDNATILFDVSDGVATITLNRPDRLNAWTGQMAREVRGAVYDAGRNPDVRVIVVTLSLIHI